jgi:serine protease Do
MRRVLPLALLFAFADAVPARADDGRTPALVRELNEKSQEIARTIGPSVVCIYVSRSDAYQKAPYWGIPHTPDYPGRLGRFDAAAARKKVPTDARHRARILRTIAEHDLSAPNVVPESYGSGIVVDRAGLVLTCAHVVKNATRIYVRQGERGSWADIHAADPRSDLAVLKLLDPPAGLKALKLGDGGKVRPGQLVWCVSNRFEPRFRGDATPTFGFGQVRRLRVPLPGNFENMFRDMPHEKFTLYHHGLLFQTTAVTTSGCSGAALVDLDSKVVGLTTALAGIGGDKLGGFAIPLDPSIRQIVERLERGEEVEYGFLGVQLGTQDRPPTTMIHAVTAGSPAMKAGLMAGDVIVRINGKAVSNTNDLFLYLGMTLAGREAEIEVRGNRFGGFTRTVRVRLAKFYWPGPVIASKQPPARFGLRVDYTSVLAQRNPFPLRWGRAPAEGVAIREVVLNSPADRARLQPDKIITHVNGTQVTTPGEYYQVIARAGNKVELTILTSRQREDRITLEEK